MPVKTKLIGYGNSLYGGRMWKKKKGGIHVAHRFTDKETGENYSTSVIFKHRGIEIEREKYREPGGKWRTQYIVMEGGYRRFNSRADAITRANEVSNAKKANEAKRAKMNRAAPKRAKQISPKRKGLGIFNTRRKLH